MKKFLAGLVSLLMLSTAFAEPTITHLGYTAYLGSSNELYLQDPTGTVRVLRYPIADILSITDTVVYCRAQDGKLLSIALDGSQSLIIAEAPDRRAGECADGEVELYADGRRAAQWRHDCGYGRACLLRFGGRADHDRAG